MEKQLFYDPVELPNENWRRLGEILQLDPHNRHILIRYGMYRFIYGDRDDTTGLMMLTGDPGTGKSDSVRWAADAVIRKFGAKGIALIINPAGLMDEHLGKSQKLVEDLFTTIDFYARKYLTVII